MKRNKILIRVVVMLLVACLFTQAPVSASGLPQVIGIVTITNAQYVNVRSGADTSFEVISQVYPGSVYPCVGIAASGWYAIMLDDGRMGYVSNGLTSFTAFQSSTQTSRPPAYNEVQLPVYYRDSLGTLLLTDYINLGVGSSVIRPNNTYMPGYRLLGPAEVTVSVSQSLMAMPQNVTFLYAGIAAVTPQPQPAYTTVPVSYVGPGGIVFYSASVRVWQGDNYLQPDYSRVPSDYRVLGNATVKVNVDNSGRPNPAAVVFSFEAGARPVSPTPAPTPRPTPRPTPGGDVAGYLPDFVKTRPNRGNYPVYTGPGTNYYRVGRATLGGGVIRVYGQENGWALIGYGLSNGGYRIGFVTMSAIPSDIHPQELSLSWIARTNVSDAFFVDDPIVTKNRVLAKSIKSGNSFILLAYLSDYWAYVQIDNFEGGKPARGFVPRKSLGL